MVYGIRYEVFRIYVWVFCVYFFLGLLRLKTNVAIPLIVLQLHLSESAANVG